MDELPVGFGCGLGGTHSELVDRGELEQDLTCDCWDSWLLDIVMFVDILLAALLVTFVDITLLVVLESVGGVDLLFSIC